MHVRVYMYMTYDARSNNPADRAVVETLYYSGAV